MIREYCDQCEELIECGKYKTGIPSKRVENKTNPAMPWFVEVKITSSGRDWKLCPLCADEVMREAFERAIGKEP